MTHPIAQISNLGEWSREPNRSSGLRYQRVTTTGVIGLPALPNVLASPKSALKIKYSNCYF